jgi:AcrR family transcriptional regulator
MTESLGRTDRRKARTRAALLAAAQTFLAEGRTQVPVQELTEAADVGIGTFYNHFATKDELFEAAVVDALDRLGDVLDLAGGDLDDPAEVFARSFRVVGRLHRLEPELSRVLLGESGRLAQHDRGLVPRARRDLDLARAAGRFVIDDLDLAMTVVVGAAMALGRLLHADPGRDDAATTDAVTVHVLLALGLGRADAEDLCSRTLPA